MLIKMYLHSTEEANLELAEELKLNELATQAFKYALYEVEFDVDVDPTTGEVEILKVNNKVLT